MSSYSTIRTASQSLAHADKMAMLTLMREVVMKGGTVVDAETAGKYTRDTPRKFYVAMLADREGHPMYPVATQAMANMNSGSHLPWVLANAARLADAVAPASDMLVAQSEKTVRLSMSLLSKLFADSSNLDVFTGLGGIPILMQCARNVADSHTKDETRMERRLKTVSTLHDLLELIAPFARDVHAVAEMRQGNLMEYLGHLFSVIETKEGDEPKWFSSTDEAEQVLSTFEEMLEAQPFLDYAQNDGNFARIMGALISETT